MFGRLLTKSWQRNHAIQWITFSNKFENLSDFGYLGIYLFIVEVVALKLRKLKM